MTEDNIVTCGGEWLSEIVDSSLALDEASPHARHLQTCDACRDVLTGLRAARDRARALEPVEPERDLWPGIEVGLETELATGPVPAREMQRPGTGGRLRGRPRPGAQEGAHPRAAAVSGADASGVVGASEGEGGGSRPAPPRGVFLSIPQLAAAGAALALFSAGTAWALAGTASPDSRGLSPLAGGIASLPAELQSDPQIASAVRRADELEVVLGAQRQGIPPDLAVVLDRNLIRLDRVIAESIDALDADPGNRFLRDHLRDAYRRRASHLEDAAVVARGMGELE